MLIQSNSESKMPFSYLWENDLIQILGAASANNLITRFQIEYHKLCESHGAISHRGLRKHLYGNIFPQMAAYKTLLKDLSPEKALSTIQKLHLLTLTGLKKRHEWICKFPFSYSVYRIAVPLALKYGHPSAGWKIEFLENSKDQICARVHQCFYYKIMKDYGITELISIYCNGDEYVFNEMPSSYIKWGRTTTLPAGGGYCDVIFYKNHKNCM
jgi:hypothetical protein